MAATGARRAGRLLAALGAAGAVLAGYSDAPPGPPPLPAPVDGLRLELTVPAPEFAPGAQVPLTFTVTNTGAGTCDLPATAVGTVTLRVERDGVPVVPQTRVLLYPDGAGAVVDAARRGVEPGGRVSFVLPATVGSTEPPDAGLALSSVTALPTGEGLAAQYALAPGGAYVVTAVYAPGPQGAGRACASSSNPATVSLTTGRAPAWWADWPDGGAGVVGAVLVLLVLLVLLLRSAARRRPHGAAVPVTVLVAVALLVVTPPQAQAATRFKPGTGGADGVTRFGLCMASFAEPGGDPAGVLGPVTDPNGPVVRIVGTDDPRNVNYTTGLRIINWSPTRTTVLGGGVPSDACADLYHEMAHAAADITGQEDSAFCDGTGIRTEEVRATFAENAYRRSQGLPERETYNGHTLPDSLDKCRDRPDKGNPAIGPCKPLDGPATCGGSDGDPHLYTFDGLAYDLQTVGEYVMVRAGDLEIQTRQAAYPDSRTVSVNTAVAARVGAERVGFLLDAGGGVAMWRDGRPATPPPGDTPLAGGTLNRDGTSYRLRWDDGSTMWVDPVGSWGLRVLATLAPARRGGAAGLLGDADGDPADDLAGRDARPLPRGPDGRLAPVDLLGPFSDGWRVAPEESLLPYAPGEDTTTHTDRTFPDAPATVDTLAAERRAAALEACTRAGVTAQPWLDSCVLDVGLTGQPAFARSLADSAAVLAVTAQPALATTAGQFTIRDGAGVGPDRPGPGAGRLEPGRKHRFALDIGAAPAVWLNRLNKSCAVTMQLLGPDGAPTGDPLTACALLPNSSQILRGTRPGPYVIEVAGSAATPTDYAFDLLAVTARDRGATAIGERLTGRLDAPGVVERWTLTTEGRRIFSLDEGTGACDDLAVHVTDAAGGQVGNALEPLCSGAFLGVPGSGTYTVEVYGVGGATGEYSLLLTPHG